MRGFTQLLTVMGEVEDIKPDDRMFSVRCNNDVVFEAHITDDTTTFKVLKNLDGIDRDPVFDVEAKAKDKIDKCIHSGSLIAVQGVWQLNEDASRFDVRNVWLLASAEDKQYLFEETHWWITQTVQVADQWLDSLFGDRRSYEEDDFVKLYETNLNINGLRVDTSIQECAVLSRLIYGFSAAFLLTGQERYRKAAKAGVAFMRESFRILSHDGQHCIWAYARRRLRLGAQCIIPSEAGDDSGSVPLYEQIYALSGLTQYYRISLDPSVLEDIDRTIQSFNDYYLDDAGRHIGDAHFKGNKDGWFSHVDYQTLKPYHNRDPKNNLKKNWNSIGDHIPAYLINLIIMLDPLPQSNNKALERLLDTARDMLFQSTELILAHFTDHDPHIPYINERFEADWTPDHKYSWQQNRAIIGHNFKIAWNLTRVANYCDTLVRSDRGEAQRWRDLSQRCMAMAGRLAKNMKEVGVDLIRGGCFDAVERNAQNGPFVEFAWLNTKDFWQQEQAILAYLILFGRQRDRDFLEMARRTEAFWNLFFLDLPNHGIFFRVTENGLPITDPSYSVRGGHSDASGYHCFELAYLAHVYNRMYVGPQKDSDQWNRMDQTFCLYFHPARGCAQESLNVLPDFVQPDRLTVKAVRVDGVPRRIADPNSFQIQLGPDDFDRTVAVEYEAHIPD